jgi:TRAP-type transport system small permease protein
MKRGNLGKVDQILAVVTKWGSVASLVILFLLIAAGVFVRFVPITSLGWADEIIELAFAWMVFLGATYLWRERTHFNVDIVPNWLAGTKAGRLLGIGLNILSLAFFAVLTYEGWLLTLRATDNSPILELPKSLWYIIIPITGTIMFGYTIRDLRLLIQRRPK